MDEAILQSALNFGVFPAVTIYLVFVIIKDFRGEMQTLKSKNDEYYREILKQYVELTRYLEQLVRINEQVQSYMVNYLNTLLIKLLDVLEDYEK